MKYEASSIESLFTQNVHRLEEMLEITYSFRRKCFPRHCRMNETVVTYGRYG